MPENVPASAVEEPSLRSEVVARPPVRLRLPASPARAKLILATVLLAICVFTAANSSTFLTWNNWANILEQVAIVGILACGTTVLMVAGGIDLSIGSNVSFTGVLIGALIVTEGIATPLALGLALLAAVTIGAINGLLVAHSTSHPFILTLGMLTLLQGGALLISTEPIQGLPTAYLDFTFNRPLGIPTLVWAFAIVAVASHCVLRHTVWGRHLYALGGSESAARLAGLRVRGLKVAIYAGMGLLVGISAILLVSQLSAAQAYAGQGLELSAIAAVAVGGTPLQGGRGDIAGTVLGVLLIGVIANALNLLEVDPNLQLVMVGGIIVVAVMAQRQQA
jgi:ribose/xylose/arabinose/galactoside ABC-type transport system permease subunit